MVSFAFFIPLIISSLVTLSFFILQKVLISLIDVFLAEIPIDILPISLLVLSCKSFNKDNTDILHFSISVTSPFSIPMDLQDFTPNISISPSLFDAAIDADNFLLPKSMDVIIPCCIFLYPFYVEKIY